MIGKGKSIAHGANGIAYAMEKEKAEVLDKRHVIGNTPKEIAQEFRTFQNFAPQTKNNCMSFVLSPTPAEGKNLSDDQYREISRDFLEKMKLTRHQAVIIKHQDKNHVHLHLFVNRIDFDGNTYKDNFIGKKSQRIADQVAQDHQLTRAKIVEKTKDKEIRKTIFNIHKEVMKFKPKNFEHYCQLMEGKGVKTHPTINKSGKLQGFRVELQGANFKASQVHRSMSFNKLKFIAQQINRGLNL